MHTLADFLNHGLLPFTGRDEQVDRLREIWRTLSTAHGMRVVLAIGEAGVGKSRLVEAFLPSVSREGGLAVHVKLYPDSAVSIAPLISHAVARATTAIGLSDDEPDGRSISDAIVALRRIARLRPLLLAVEDIHLLRDDGLAEFHRLIDALGDEHILVFAVARPLDSEVLAVLERHIVQVLSIEGLDSDAVATLWERIFDSPIDPSVLQVLMHRTLGNPLALRSALRAAVNSGTMLHDVDAGGWFISAEIAAFDDVIERGVRVLSEGMAVHLDAEERHAALRLATLGEIFSHDAARQLLDDPDRMVQRLMFKGIVRTSDTPATALCGTRRDGSLLEFTHTLIHRHLVEAESPDLDAIVGAIASDAAIYSAVPFELLESADGSLSIDSEIARRAFNRINRSVPNLNETTDWRLALRLRGAAKRIYEEYRDALPAERRVAFEAILLYQQLLVDLRQQHTDEFRALAEQMLDVTMQSEHEPVIGMRILAASFLYLSSFRRDPSECRGIWDRVETMVGQYPWLRYSREYLSFLRRVLLSLNNQEFDGDLRRLTVERVESLDADTDAPQEFITQFRRIIYPELLGIFSDRETFERRLRLLEDIEERISPGQFMTKRIWLRFYAGRFVEIERLMPEAFDRTLRLGEHRGYYFCRLIHLAVRMLLGEEFATIHSEAEELFASIPEEIRASFALNFQQYLSACGLLCAGPAAGCRAAESFGISRDLLDMAENACYAVMLGTPDAFEYALRNGEPDHTLHDLLRAAAGDPDVDRAAARRSAVAVFEADAYVFFDFIEVVAAIDLLQYCERHEALQGLTAELHDLIQTSLQQWLDWMCASDAVAVVATTLDRFGSFLSKRELRERRAQLAAARERHSPAPSGTEKPHRLRLSMIGEIAVTISDEPPARVRGSRLARFLALLVADRMLSEPLTFREMCELLDSHHGPVDPERLRKGLNDAVYRVRELLGADAVITERERSELNLDVVEVDLIEAHRSILEAARSVVSGSLAQALPLLLRTFDMLDQRGELFPGLHDDFFDAARAEFEFRLHESTLHTARGLIAAGDLRGAERLLERADNAMPGDEDIAEMLDLVLNRQGRFTAAARRRLDANELR